MKTSGWGMIAYASSTGTLRNLEALRARGWRLMMTPARIRAIRPGFQFAIDNGAFSKEGFQAEAFEGLIELYGAAADFVVLPDIVAGGKESLELSVSWLPRLRELKHLMLPVQDGMTAHDVGMVLRQNVKVGLFLGGSTEFKLREMYAWGMVAHCWRRHYHVGRVNTARRIRLAAEAGADSFDRTSATMYAETVPLLDAARKQPSLLAPSLCS